MKETTPNYSDFFRPGQRAKVELPLGNSTFFREWASIASVSANLLSISLSRDLLPNEAALQQGEPVAIRAGSGGQGYRCKGTIHNADDYENLAIKLAGPVIPDELRAYYRLDTSFPVELSSMDSGESWDTRQGRPITGQPSGNPGSMTVTVNYPNGFFSQPHGNILPAEPGKCLVVNISGGGLRAELQEELPKGSLLNLSFQLPQGERTLPAVAEVVYCEPQKSIWRSGTRYIAGLRYINIHERTRDSIIKYVCSEEIRKIRECNKEYHSLSPR